MARIINRRRKLSDRLGRVKMLITGRVVWIDLWGEHTEETLNWRTRWALMGVHSYNWDWVKKYGKRPCGCTRNPLTRRWVLYSTSCPKYDPLDLFAMTFEEDI